MGDAPGLTDQRKRELDDEFAFYYTQDWINVLTQTEVNASLSRKILGEVVTEENIPARIAALIRKRKEARAAQMVQERKNR